MVPVLNLASLKYKLNPYAGLKTQKLERYNIYGLIKAITLGRQRENDINMPVALASSVPQGLIEPLIPSQNMLNFKLMHKDPLLQTGQKRCMVEVVWVSGRAGLQL